MRGIRSFQEKGPPSAPGSTPAGRLPPPDQQHVVVVVVRGPAGADHLEGQRRDVPRRRNEEERRGLCGLPVPDERVGPVEVGPSAADRRGIDDM